MRLSLADDRAAQLLTRLDESLDLPAAQIRLETASAVVSYGADAAHPWAQAALASTVACARKMFRGGVFLAPGPDVSWALAAPAPRSLRRVLQTLGATWAPAPAHSAHLHVGSGPAPSGAFVAWTEGWTAAVGRGPAPTGLTQGNEISGALAAALLVSEAFRRQVVKDLLAGRKTVRLSAWGPNPPTEVQLRHLPTDLWLLGMGNLGQATLWILGLLPYADPRVLRLLLQDGDVAGPENLNVQLLTEPDWIGRRKVRQAAAWAEARGFRTTLCERRFDDDSRPGRADPRVILAGVDNLPTRRLVPAAGFDLVVDAGLGATGPEAFDFRLHAFPGARSAAQAWPEAELEAAVLTPALEKAVREGLIDQCGAMTVAGKSVGVPCTALAAAALQVAQVCRAIATRRCADRVDASLRLPDSATWSSTPADIRDLKFVKSPDL